MMRGTGGSHCRRGGLTLVELLIVIFVVLAAAAFLLPLLAREIDYARRAGCGSLLMQIGTGQSAYMNTYGDFWVFQDDGRPCKDGLGLNMLRDGKKTAYNNPCVSLSILYPQWVSDVTVFACPATDDTPVIIKERLGENGDVEFSWFGKMNGGRFKPVKGDAEPDSIYPEISHKTYAGQTWYAGSTEPIGKAYAEYAKIPSDAVRAQFARNNDEDDFHGPYPRLGGQYNTS